MSRLIIAFLLILSVSPATAQTSGQDCPDPAANGSVIFPLNQNCILRDRGSSVWKFTGPQKPDGMWELLVNGGCFGCFEGVSAERQAGGADDNIWIEKKFPHCGTVWQLHTYHYNQWAIEPGRLVTNFVNTTQSTRHASLADLLFHAHNNDKLSIGEPPRPFNCWPDAAGIGQSGISVTIAKGTRFSDVQTSKGIVVLNGNGITIDGGDFNGAIRISDNAQRPTLENMVIHDGCGAIGTSCILSGGHNGTVTLKNVTVYGGGDSADYGQDHNVYVSADPKGDPLAGVDIDGLVSTDVTNGGWTLKMRPGCVDRSCIVTNSMIGCTAAGAHCEQNGVVDMPCGGNYTISNSVLERGPGGDNWFIARAGEELGSRGCLAGGYAANTITLDNDIIIWDGKAPGNPGYIPVLCGGQSTCITTSPRLTLCVKNSIIVSDPNAPFPLSLGPQVVDCGPGGNSNVFFASRAAANAARHWTKGDPSFPFLPPHPKP